MVDFKKLLPPEPEPHVSIDGVPVDPDTIPEGSLTPTQWAAVRANSPGFKALYSKLDDEALIDAVEHNLKNCFELGSPGTYPHTLQHILIPLLLKRLRGRKP